MLTSRDLSLRNPVARAELKHLRRSIPTTGNFSRWAMRGILSAAVCAAVIIFCVSLALAFSTPSATTLAAHVRGSGVATRWLIHPLVALAGLTVLIYFSLMFRTLSLAGNTVSREKRGGTWENLLLTGMDARRLVLGKWWAVICTVWREYALLALLCVGVCAGGGVLYLSQMAPGRLLSAWEPVLHPAAGVILSAAFAVTFTATNGLFTAAVGVTGSLLSRDGHPGVMMALAVRVVSPVVPLAAAGLMIRHELTRDVLNPAEQSIFEIGEQLRVSFALMMALLDNGTSLSMMAAASDYPGWRALALGGLAAMLIYAALTLALLFAGRWIAQRQGVSA
jgi:hypothetical protein